MIVNIADFAFLMPEIWVLSMASLLLVVDVFLTDDQRIISFFLALLTVLGAAVASSYVDISQTNIVLSGTFVSDRMSVVLKMFIYIAVTAIFIYSRQYLINRNMFKGEFFVIALFGMLGMMVMVSAHHMLTIYLGLELMSLSMYALVAMHRDSGIASEAAMKYFVLGALASGLLLYGISLLYGATGTLDLGALSYRIGLVQSTDMVLILGVVFVVAGIAFKLGAVPFHMWVPDIYHGASTAVTLYIGTAPKIAAFAMVMRLLVEGLGPLQPHWQQFIMVLAVLSMFIGNVVAIAQTNIKRMLAYSTIAHVGFLLLGILAGTQEGYSASMFYILVYSIMGLGGFGMIIVLSRAGFEADRIEDFKGLNDRSPWFAGVMLVLMISMAGVPPAVGFYAKLSVLQAIVNSGFIWLAVLAVVFSIIGAFYYLRVIKFMYFDKAEDNSPLMAGGDVRVLMSANGLAVLLLGLFPGALMALCSAVVTH
ncbi:MAG: NADH-quinone oxidoreductase subunit NuoN [Gammaproteobacteria bacterium]|nr:NADH-quinone oxidoreductase subunit NuoN [Gammaproteobacteria bacterium]